VYAKLVEIGVESLLRLTRVKYAAGNRCLAAVIGEVPVPRLRFAAALRLLGNSAPKIAGNKPRVRGEAPVLFRK
jgi:hypothetical protein